jgi:hypothetical protein
MKRLLILLAACLSLALPAAALAGMRTSTRVGSAFSGKVVSTGCSVTRSRSLGTATLSCTSASGRAAAHYGFMLPRGCSSAVKPHVDWQGKTPSIAVSATRTNVSVTVRIAGRGRTSVAMVSIAYNC